MSRIVCITGVFPIYERGIKTNRTEFVVSHGVDMDTGRDVILQCVPPAQLGAKFDQELGEWVIDDGR